MTPTATNPSQYWGHTWSPIHGCSKVSRGCDNCWALAMARRHEGNPKVPWSRGLVDANGWTGKIVSAPDHLWEAPLHWRKPAIVLAFAMTDLFHPNTPTDWIDRALQIMGECPQHTFLVPTKRPENIECKLYEVTKERPCREFGGGDYLLNLWIGASVEDQKTANSRLPRLIKAWKGLKFVSVEPLLSPINFLVPNAGKKTDRLGWVIVGGESGPDAWATHQWWVRAIRDQCAAAETPFFFKGWGARIAPGQQQDLLDGVAHHEFPEGIKP